MDWLPIVITLATAAFLVPIVNDYQRKTAGMGKKISALDVLIGEIEESNIKEKEEETSVIAELKEVESELAELEKEYNELKKAIDSKKKKKK